MTTGDSGAPLACTNLDALRQARFSPSARHVTRIFRSENTEYFVVGWEPGQQSSVHGHEGFESTVIVLAGTIEFWEGNGRTAVIGAGALSFTPPGCLHQMRNVGGTRAVTLHLYSPPTIGSMPEPFTDLLRD